MKYIEFLERTSFTKPELLGFAYGTLIEDAPENISALPTPPLLMVDQITHISKTAQQRSLCAEKAIRLDDWFFHCHFLKDPVQPGCLGVDAIWQLLGFYCAASGALGTGRALGCKEVEFFGQIRPHNQIVRYEIEIHRYQSIPQTQTALIIGSAKVFVDGAQVYSITHAKVGTFLGIRYGNYPFLDANAMGGPAR